MKQNDFGKGGDIFGDVWTGAYTGAATTAVRFLVCAISETTMVDAYRKRL